MRWWLLPLTGLAVAMIAAGPAFADDSTVKNNAEGAPIAGVLGDVVDGIGGVLKILVGPPISSPTPYLGLEGAAMPAKPAPEQPDPSPAVAAPPTLGPEAPAAAQPAVTVPAAVTPAPPDAIAPTPKVTAPLPAVSPPIKPAPRPVPPSPALAAPAPRPPVPAAAEPVCARRIAATATLEQAARLPRCPH
jgi:hypothetical protein